MLTAIRTNVLDWSLDTCNPMDRLRARIPLRERLQLSIADLNDNQHASFADHESRGVFGGFTVLERRGWWRVEYSIQME